MSECVQVYRKTSSPRQVVLFPFGGGSGYSYISLIGKIERSTEIVMINPPGHLFNPGKPLESIDEMVSIYLKELRPVLKARPVLFGHSIGGLVAYELCRQLELERDVKKLIISGVNPPHVIKEGVDLYSWMEKHELIQKCSEIGGMPQVFKTETEMLEMFIAGLRGDLKALETYNSQDTRENGKLKTSGAILYSTGDYIVDPMKVKDWRTFMDCTEITSFEGDHFYLFEELNMEKVIRVFSKYL
jgi:surfactin synthase thioesterase subunit